MNYEQVYEALDVAGYKRGNMMGFFVERLQSLGEYVKVSGSAQVEEVLTRTEPKNLKQILASVKGIGPKVVENYVILRAN